MPKSYERSKYALKKFDIILITKTYTKLKSLIHWKIDPIPNNEIAEESIQYRLMQRSKIFDLLKLDYSKVKY